MCEARGWKNRRYRFLVKTSGAWPRASRAKASNPHRYPPGGLLGLHLLVCGRCGVVSACTLALALALRSFAFMSLGEELLRKNVDVESPRAQMSRVFKVRFCRAQRARLSSEGRSKIGRLTLDVPLNPRLVKASRIDGCSYCCSSSSWSSSSSVRLLS